VLSVGGIRKSGVCVCICACVRESRGNIPDSQALNWVTGRYNHDGKSFLLNGKRRMVICSVQTCRVVRGVGTNPAFYFSIHVYFNAIKSAWGASLLHTVICLQALRKQVRASDPKCLGDGGSSFKVERFFGPRLLGLEAARYRTNGVEPPPFFAQNEHVSIDSMCSGISKIPFAAHEVSANAFGARSTLVVHCDGPCNQQLSMT